MAYNPYRDERGRFSSADGTNGSVETLVRNDYQNALTAGDDALVSEIEEYVEEHLSETEFGQSVLRGRYGLFGAVKCDRTADHLGLVREPLREADSSCLYNDVKISGRLRKDRIDEDTLFHLGMKGDQVFYDNDDDEVSAMMMSESERDLKDATPDELYTLYRYTSDSYMMFNDALYQ